MPKYSVIVVSAGINEWYDMTVPAINSLRANTLTDYEGIIVDNGGRNRGVVNFSQMVPYAEAVNKAAEFATGDRLIILNNDITAYGDWLAVFDKYDVPYSGAVRLLKEGVSYLEGWCICIDHDLWHMLGGFNEVYKNSWEDVDLAWRLLRLGIKPTLLPIPIRHVWGATRSRYPGANKWDEENRQYLLTRIREEKHKWQKLD